jgi:hypothetical protein
MHRNKHNKNRREGIGLVLIAIFFIFLIFYLRFVVSHTEEIRRRQRGGAAEGPVSSNSKNLDRRHLIAEDEIEGGLGVEWDLLSDKKNTDDSNKRHPPASLQLAPSTSAPQAPPEGEPHVERAQRPTSAFMPVPRRTFRHKSVQDNIHSRPLSGDDRFPLRRHSADDVVVASSPNLLLRAYQGILENPLDSAFFQAETHVFSQVPEFATILKKWQTLNLDMRSGKRPARYVTVHPVGQLCNRLMAITSAAMLAILTQRGLVVDDTGFYAQSSDLFEEPGFRWVDGALSSLGGHYITNPEGGVWVDTEKLLCMDYAHAYPEDHIEMSINQYLVPYMTNNPHYRDAIRSLTGGTMDVFYPLSHFLFRPVAAIRSWRDDFVATHFRGKFVVGLQVRSGSDFTDHFMSPADWKIYHDCAEAVVPEPDDGDGGESSQSPKDIIYFLATDTEEGRRMGIAALQSSLPKRDVLVSTKTFLLSNHPEGVQKALLDILLLSACDDRVSTAWSSYGYFAAGFSGLNGNLVVDSPPSEIVARDGAEQRFMGVPHKSDKRRQCVRLPTHQPCFHKFESWGASKSTCFSKEMFEREMLNGRYC